MNRRSVHIRRFIMVSQVSKEAVKKLRAEMQKTIGTSYGTFVMNRLKNENPYFAFIGNSLLDAVRMKFGQDAHEVTLNIIAVCYRILELSEHYPDEAQVFANALLADPLLHESDEEILFAQKKTTELLKKYMLPKGK